MRALRMERTGALDALYVGELPAPECAPGDLLVLIEAAAINPSDVKNVRGGMAFTTTPRTPGRDFAGVVARGPAEWLGKRVWGSGGQYGFTLDGAHAEYIARPVDSVGVAPSNLTPAEAAACGVPFVTAQTALFDAGGLTKSDTLVIIGAAGGVGGSAVQLAARKCVKVIGVVRNDGQASTVEASGGIPLVCPNADDLPDAVKEATGGHGASIVFDTVGGSMVRSALASLAHRGRLVEIAAPQREVTIDLLDFYRRDIHLIGVNTLNLDASDCARILDALRPAFEAGKLRAPSIGARFNLDDAPKAYVTASEGKTGKVVIEVG